MRRTKIEMGSIFQSFCSCLNRVFANDVAVKEEVMKVESFDRGNPLNELLLRNLLTVRGRRNLIKDYTVEIVPTKFEASSFFQI